MAKLTDRQRGVIKKMAAGCKMFHLSHSPRWRIDADVLLAVDSRVASALISRGLIEFDKDGSSLSKTREYYRLTEAGRKAAEEQE